MTGRAEKLLILLVMAGFFLFLLICSCKNENLIDPLDILDPNRPEMWSVCADCGLLPLDSGAQSAPPPGGGEISVCTGPNPTSEPICFQYVLPSEMDVALAIYSQKGEKVASIVRERQTVGGHFATWNLTDDNGNQVINGTYRAYFMAGGFGSHGDIVVSR